MSEKDLLDITIPVDVLSKQDSPYRISISIPAELVIHMQDSLDSMKFIRTALVSALVRQGVRSSVFSFSIEEQYTARETNLLKMIRPHLRSILYGLLMHVDRDGSKLEHVTVEDGFFHFHFS